MGLEEEKLLRVATLWVAAGALGTLALVALGVAVAISSISYAVIGVAALFGCIGLALVSQSASREYAEGLRKRGGGS